MSNIKEQLADPQSPLFLTPVGRLVSGNLWEPKTMDQMGKPLTVKSGPNAGQPRMDYSFGIAIPKSDPGLPLMFAKMTNEARRGFPKLFDANGACLLADFAWKFQDGDSTVPNKNGVTPAERQGWKGCYVFFFSGSNPTKVIDRDPNVVLTDPNSVKMGWYVRVSGSFKENNIANGTQPNPGIYVNHNFVQLCGFGEEINFGPSASEVFSAAPAPVLPPGASATPLAPTSIPGVGAPGAPVTAAPPMAPVTSVPGAPAAAAGGPLPTQPATGWLNPPPPASAPAPAAPVAPVSPVEKKYLYSGQVYTESQLRAGGHTDAHLATYQVIQ